MARVVFYPKPWSLDLIKHSLYIENPTVYAKRLSEAAAAAAAMAVVARFSCFFTHPKTSARSPPSDQFSLKSTLLEPWKSAFLPFKVEAFGENQIEVLEMSPATKCQGATELRFPAMELLLGNALMFTAPLNALAETCEADNSFFNMPLLLSVALVGATVGGLVARQRKGELQRVNEQLRQINAALRRQAKIESYAPTLSYAPSGRIPESEVIIDPRKHELISRLKAGKNFLRNQEPQKASTEFKAALELAQSLEDSIEEKKAARGLGASLQRQGQYRDAIKYHSMVLAISEREGEDSGNTEAYGAIADCYTELGDLESAGKFYDNYIARLEKD
ncbi:putative tetratricopeptide-like helical domain-containing protein [Rosa chinensis]|uniref:Putative tetratricopeptide-like helical domain-containing protein n=1 Tax=Rosa chinensis TaxID=74649 RepID=A0A2P6RYV6_ROSCH|nr:protein FLUORESCENT IN BLUE LIGHT, chloroplastic isoform X1 [Rosa chinensis]PRQ51616.1 putative tetratricopeptide-like helical domain-containing protein [Rosa chinensis]